MREVPVIYSEPPRRVIINLRPDEFERLSQIAEAERRGIREQASYLLSERLAQATVTS